MNGKWTISKWRQYRHNFLIELNISFSHFLETPKTSCISGFGEIVQCFCFYYIFLQIFAQKYVFVSVWVYFRNNRYFFFQPIALFKIEKLWILASKILLIPLQICWFSFIIIHFCWFSFEFNTILGVIISEFNQIFRFP